MTVRGRSRAYVTGLAVVSPAGCSVEAFWATLLRGDSTARTISSFDPTSLPVRFACEATQFDPTAWLSEKQVRRHDRFAQFSLLAAAAAVSDAGLEHVTPERAGVVAGTGFGGIGSLEKELGGFLSGQRVHPLTIPMTMPNSVAAQVAIELGWQGPNLSISTACAAGTHAIGEAARLVSSGLADVVLAGAAEASISPFVISAFAALRALSARNDAPELASRPFDAARDGFVLGEGAAFLVIESEDHLEFRRAKRYAEVVGYASTNDAYHLVMPAPDGGAGALCMRRAIEDAGLTPADIAHVNAHGTSTSYNDAAEARALTAVFGDAVPPITATKSTIGHLIGAAGAVEAIAAILSLVHGVVPPTANVDTVDEPQLDVVRGSPRVVPRGPVLSNSFAFGGHNASVVLAPGHVGVGADPIPFA